jgi:hypothetical protein
MAETKRLTAADKRLLADAKRAEDNRSAWARFTESYPTRFASLMWRYLTQTAAGFRVKKLDDETYEFDRDDYSYRTYELKVTPPVNYVWEVMDAMDSAESYLEDYAREVAEEERKYLVKVAALNKLSAEEKELLGL